MRACSPPGARRARRSAISASTAWLQVAVLDERPPKAQALALARLAARGGVRRVSSRYDPGKRARSLRRAGFVGGKLRKKYQAPAAAHSGALMCMSAPYPTKSLAFGDIGVYGPSQPQRSSCRHGSHRSRPARSPIIMALGGDRMAWLRAQRPAGKPISHQSSCENRNPVLYRRSSERAHARRAARRGKRTRRKILIWDSAVSH